MNVETMLRDGLAGQAASLELPEDPWPGFAGRERRHRRRRRVRAGAFAVVLTALVGLQSGVLPMPGWVPGIAIAATNSALLNSPPRGTLAGDAGWQDGMRALIEVGNVPGENWEITDRRDITFLYASDVGDRRLALVHVPLRLGFLTDQQLAWYTGPAGAAPAEMVPDSFSRGVEQARSTMYAAADAPGAIAVVGPVGWTASISNGHTFGADGRVRHAPPVTGAVGSGFVEMVVPPTPVMPSPVMTLSRGDEVITLDVSGWYDGPAHDPDAYRAVAADALGDRDFDPNLLGEWISNAIAVQGLALDGLRVEVRWTGMIDGQPTALFTVQQRPGDGVLAFAVSATGEGASLETLRLLLPEQGAAQRPIGWRKHTSTSERTDRMVLVGPPGATTVTVAVDGGTPARITLDDTGRGETTVPLDATSVLLVAYAADGTEIASSPVPPFEGGPGIIGDSPATRVVP
ncbi:hypothetical protein [Catenuloplanes indicus]|uniref:Uncharacterized protein n=1 Tax=Catenuloplanes indicus TaxID=137267 RepID=A0AAE3W500_9ACTN|nr:hypothetical protein [Catenuloplanes indicus]MDQ0369417.1 hypothetical protein [Catenuloplanes indicus]